MDDKTINLWRQIEGGRRAGRRLLVNRGKPGSLPAREPANDLA